MEIKSIIYQVVGGNLYMATILVVLLDLSKAWKGSTFLISLFHNTKNNNYQLVSFDRILNLVTGHFVPRSFRTQVISYHFDHFVPPFIFNLVISYPIWSFRTNFVPSLVISYLLLLFSKKKFWSFRTYILLFRTQVILDCRPKITLLPPPGNFADIVYLKEQSFLHRIRDVCTL